MALSPAAEPPLEELVFLKLGGSAITDKQRAESARVDIVQGIARQIASARRARPELRLLLGHGSGSFGHYAAQKTHFGEHGNWASFAETGAAAGRLNRLIADIFLAEGLPVVTIQPSATALCRDGELIELGVTVAKTALEHGLVPLVYGDVAFDAVRGMAIVSTEMLFAYLAARLRPARIILAGMVEGVFTADPHREPMAQQIREITPSSYPDVERQLCGSHGYDVTGGMLSKVKTMLKLVEQQPQLQVRLLSALKDGLIERALKEPSFVAGTLIHVG